MNVSLLDFVSANDGRSLEDRWEAYQQAKRDAEIERRARFAALGISEGALCPASLLHHRESRYSPLTELPLSSEESAQLARTFDYKRYPGAPAVALPEPPQPLTAALDETIRERRSAREFSDSPLALHEIARLLTLSAGVTHGKEIPRRAAPSAGALFPIEIYPLIFAAEGLGKGIYHYAPLTNELEHVKALEHWRVLWPLLDTNLEGATPAVAFVLTARLARVQAKYGERGYRFALMECGHIAQNMLLVATAMGLKSLPVGGFFDTGVNCLLGVDGEQEMAQYIVLAGKA